MELMVSVNVIRFIVLVIISGGRAGQAERREMQVMKTARNNMVPDMIKETHVAGPCGRRQHPSP